MAQPATDFDRSMQILYEVDCAARRHRLVQFQRFKGRMGGGEPARGGMLFGGWVTTGPGTVGGGITRAVCPAAESRLQQGMAGRVVIERIVCGGQTGADRTTLDWAVTYDVPHG